MLSSAEDCGLCERDTSDVVFRNPPPVQWPRGSKIVSLLDRDEATRIFVKGLHDIADVVEVDVSQRPLIRTGGAITTPSDHLCVVVFQREDKMSSLDTPAPPLHPLSMSIIERDELTDHILPDLTEVLKEMSGDTL